MTFDNLFTAFYNVENYEGYRIDIENLCTVKINKSNDSTIL